MPDTGYYPLCPRHSINVCCVTNVWYWEGSRSFKTKAPESNCCVHLQGNLIRRRILGYNEDRGNSYDTKKRRDVNYHEDRSSSSDAMKRHELSWRQKQRLCLQGEMSTAMKTEAAVMIKRRDVNCYEDRSSGHDSKKRCELPWRQKQQLWCQEER